MKVTFTKYIDNDSIVMLKGKTKLEVLNEIISKAAQRSQLDRDLIFRLTWKREQMMTTGVGNGLGLPHIYRDNFGRNEEYFICTADPKYFKTGMTRSTSAASSLSWACKWILLCEMWMNGEISDDVALEGNY